VTRNGILRNNPTAIERQWWRRWRMGERRRTSLWQLKKAFGFKHVKGAVTLVEIEANESSMLHVRQHSPLHERIDVPLCTSQVTGHFAFGFPEASRRMHLIEIRRFFRTDYFLITVPERLAGMTRPIDPWVPHSIV
jgi:hypothetical protein